MNNNFLEKNLLTGLKSVAGVILVASSLLILFTTLLPFNFVFPDNPSLEFIIDRLTKHSSWGDLFANLLLFLPFGFSLAALIDRNRLNPLNRILIVSIASIILSSSVEFLQVFLPSRKPTSVDIISNSLSGCLGSVFYYAVRDGLERTSAAFLVSLSRFFQPLLSLPSLTVMLVGYIVAVSFLLWNVQTATQLHNWENHFPLIIGDEFTRYRSWEGQISRLCISNQAASKAQIDQLFAESNSCEAMGDSLIADYELTELKNSYGDRTGNLPDLEWIETPSTQVNERGIFLGGKHALITPEPAKLLTEKIKQTSQFTIGLTITTSNFTQEGPARILTISNDVMRRNFMIGQSGSELRVRLRNPLTGLNGMAPEIQVVNFFADANTHQMVVSYTGSEFLIYVDNIDNLYSIKFTPEAALFWSLLSAISEKIFLNPENNRLYWFLYHGFIFIPIGVILGLISGLYRGNLLFYLLLTLGGVVLPALLIEGVLASTVNGVWSWKNVGLYLAIILITFMAVRGTVGRKLQPE